MKRARLTAACWIYSLVKSLLVMSIGSCFVSCDRPSRPSVKPRPVPSILEQKDMLKRVARELIRVEMIVYRSGGERVGPIVVTDKSDIAEMRRLLDSVEHIDSMDQPHAMFLTEDEVNLTLVFDEIADYRARVVGPMFMFFEEESAIGGLPVREFDALVDRLVANHRKKHPEDCLNTKPPSGSAK